jgi:hypothetical protein
MTARDMEVEALIYWRASTALSAVRVAFAAPDIPLGREARDNLEAISMHSEWPRLRTFAALALAGRKRGRAAG